MYRCGPASVQAIKHGQICFPFDAAFVFAEVSVISISFSRNSESVICLQPTTRQIQITSTAFFSYFFEIKPLCFSLQVNSDVVFYARSRDGTMETVKVNKTHVGRKILTKAPGDTTQRDITDQYKFAEGKQLQQTQISVF